MNRNLKLVVNNLKKDEEIKYFFEKNELKIILDLYAKWYLKDLGETTGFLFLANK